MDGCATAIIGLLDAEGSALRVVRGPVRGRVHCQSAKFTRQPSLFITVDTEDTASLLAHQHLSLKLKHRPWEEGGADFTRSPAGYRRWSCRGTS